MFSMAMWMATLVAPIQILAGDQHGLNTLEHQPAKVMAMEGHYQSHPNGAPLILFGLPDQAAGKVKYAIEIPKLGSLILKHSLDAPLAGLDTVPRENWPPVPITFWSFRIMVGTGIADAGARPVQPVDALARHALSIPAAAHVRGGDGPGRVSSPCSQAGSPPRPGGSRSRSMACCERPNSASPLAAPAVASSLIAFVIVYFIVFAAGADLHPAADGIAAASRRTGTARATSRPAPPALRPPPASLAEGSAR